MPLGNGYWYDRRRRRYHLIDDHAKAVCRNPGRYGLTYLQLQHAILRYGLHPTTCQGQIVITGEDVREAIIHLTCVAGFIRVRHWKGELGWQFAGDPDDALAVLKRFIASHEIGPLTLITFSDFGMNASVTDRASQFASKKPGTAVQSLIDNWLERYEIRQRRGVRIPVRVVT